MDNTLNYSSRYVDNKGDNIMAVRAKVRCQTKADNVVEFTTVYETDEQKSANAAENVRFTKATPWGNIRMNIDNPAAMDQFEVGKEYYVDFNPVNTDQQPANSATHPGG